MVLLKDELQRHPANPQIWDDEGEIHPRFFAGQTAR
jgi:hypothetical protein